MRPWDLLNDFRSQGALNTSQRFGVGHLFGADSRKHPIDHVGPNLTFERVKAPVPYVLQQHQHPRRIRPALLSALASRFVAAAGVRPRYTVSIIEKSSA